ncbi:hypothetical protein K474DRAFT_1731626 [Panus rudis PR-1116 ss-1]|nr:hypothetical protein K474DRAFT_1731626 [Panus rudis PR-1116 ss-1]
MVATATTGHYACKCLNVQIYPRPPPGNADPAEKDYTTIYVGDEGISVAHPQLTLRTRSRAKDQSQGDEIRLTRYMSLTCLICQTLVYRVLQVITPDLDSGEGPVPPTEDFAESELLKSSSGWIELYKDCIWNVLRAITYDLDVKQLSNIVLLLISQTGEAITKAECSPSYSHTFRIVLPSAGSPSSSSEAPPKPVAPEPPQLNTEQQRHLPSLPPLFLPPPFTPSHTVFRHISAVAIEVSNKLRDDAEAFLAKIAAEKAAEVQAAESELRREVETIWIHWKRAIDRVEEEVKQQKRSRSRGRSESASFSETTDSGPPTANGHPGSIRISNFIPEQASSLRMSSRGSSLPATSALSASLATSFFRHPRAQAERQQSPPTASLNGASRSSVPPDGPRSPATASSRTLALPINNESATIREAYRRNMDENKDIATSFRYVMDMAERMDESRVPVVPEEDLIPSHNTVPSPASVPRGRSPRTTRSGFKKVDPDAESKPKEQPQTSENRGAQAKVNEDDSSRQQEQDKKEATSKGTRRVKFVVNPDVTIIGGDNSNQDQEVTPQGREEDVFDFENETESGERRDDMVQGSSESTTPVRQEHVKAPRRPPRAKGTNMAGLPASLSSLRPVSLPLPSNMRPPIVPQEPTPINRARSEVVKEAVTATESERRKPSFDEVRELEEVEDELDSREAEILRLVNAQTPSHRSAWKRNSKAWRMFVDRSINRAAQVDSIMEEDEDSTTSSRAGYYDESEDGTTEEEDSRNDLRYHIAGSAPIPIAPIAQGRSFGQASYQVKTSLSDRPGMLVPAYQRASSAALRRASYAERDRFRAIDPGLLDFDTDDDADEEAEEDIPIDGDVGGKARQRALKIMQARDEMPDAGMWRSLA